MIETYYRILIRDKKGEIVKDTGLKPSRSYVLQFLQLLQGWMRPAYDGGGTYNAKDTSGASTVIMKGVDDADTKGRCNAPIGNDDYGILVGSGTAAEDNEDYELDTKIEHSGVGAAGRLNYQAMQFVAPQILAGNVDFYVFRTFLNETGLTITVRELGLVCYNTVAGTYHLLLRDVVTPEDVDDGYTLTALYTLRSTV